MTGFRVIYILLKTIEPNRDTYSKELNPRGISSYINNPIL